MSKIEDLVRNTRIGLASLSGHLRKAFLLWVHRDTVRIKFSCVSASEDKAEHHQAYHEALLLNP